MKIKTGDKLPSSELFYLDQSNDVKKIDILDLCKNNRVIILGMPGAFTKTCSALHLPGYIKNYELSLKKGISKIICISANDPNSELPVNIKIISNKTPNYVHRNDDKLIFSDVFYQNSDSNGLHLNLSERHKAKSPTSWSVNLTKLTG